MTDDLRIEEGIELLKVIKLLTDNLPMDRHDINALNGRIISAAIAHQDKAVKAERSKGHWIVEDSLKRASCNCGYSSSIHSQRKVIEQHVAWKLAVQANNTGGE